MGFENKHTIRQGQAPERTPLVCCVCGDSMWRYTSIGGCFCEKCWDAEAVVRVPLGAAENAKPLREKKLQKS